MSETQPVVLGELRDNPGVPELQARHGEIKNQGKKAEQSKLNAALESSVNILSGYIETVLDKKGNSKYFVTAEANGIRRDIAKELRNKVVGEEVITEIKGEPYFDTGKIIAIPTESGDAEFKIIIFQNQDTKQFKFQLEAKNPEAQRLESVN